MSVLDNQTLQNLAEARLEDAKALFHAGRYDGAMYMAGYVVELLLKARICILLKLKSWNDLKDLKNIVWVHDYKNLLILSGWKEDIEIKKKENKQFETNWNLLDKWRPDYRYLPVGTRLENETRELLEAIEDEQNGIYSWMKSNLFKR